MKPKTARRWLSRNKWKIAAAKARGDTSPIWWKHYYTMKMEAGYVLFRKFRRT